jgi:hypothetical protein
MRARFVGEPTPQRREHVSMIAGTAQRRMPNAPSDRLLHWLTPELRRNARDELISAFMKVVIALFSGAVISALAFYLFGRLSVGAGAEGVLIALAIPPGILVLALIPQAIQTRAERGVMQVHGHRMTFTDTKNVLGNPNDTGGLAHLLMFPAWLCVSAVESMRAAYGLLVADPEFCARVLSYLASEDRRVFIGDLEHTFSTKLVPALRALRHFPGVQVTSREAPALLLSPELGAQVRSMM